MNNIILSLVIFTTISISIFITVREKRKGVKCVGCPYSQNENCNCK